MALTAQQLKDLQNLVTPVSPGGFSDPNTPVSDYFRDLGIGFVRYIMLEFGVYAFMVAILISGVIYIFSFGKEESITKAKNSLIFSFIGFIVFVSANAILNYYTKTLGIIVGSISTKFSFSTITGQVFNTALVTAGVGFLIVLVYSGLRYFFVVGSEEAESSAKRGITYAFIGLIVAASAYAISQIIIKNVLLLGL